MSVGLAGAGAGVVQRGKGPELGSTGVTWASGRTGGFREGMLALLNVAGR